MKKKKVIYTDEPIGALIIIKDFLPKPEDLSFEKRINCKNYIIFVNKKEKID